MSGWSDADAGLGAGNSNPCYNVHPDKHAIVFADNDSNTMYLGCDGGYTNQPMLQLNFHFRNFNVKNRGYNVTQNYGIAAGLMGDVLGGSQDNGTNYINYLGNDPWPQWVVMALIRKSSAAMVFLPYIAYYLNFYFGGVYWADFRRSGSGGTGSYSTFYDIKVDPLGIGIHQFVAPQRLLRMLNLLLLFF